MVALPTENEIPLVTAEMPQSRVSAGDIERSGGAIAQGLDKLGAGLGDLAVPFAQKQAASDLEQQKVTLNADGSPNVVTPQTSMIFGQAGDAYAHAMMAGTVAQYGNITHQHLADLHQQYPLDPQGFRTAAGSWLDGITANLSGPAKQAVLQEGASAITGHYDGIVSNKANSDVEIAKGNILANIDQQKNTLIGLARQSGTGTPQFKDAQAKLNTAYDSLGTNPRFGVPPDRIMLEKNQTSALLHGEAVDAGIDRTLTRGGKAEAQKELTDAVWNNPDLSETDRHRLYQQGLAHLEYLTSGQKAGIAANKQAADAMEQGLFKGVVRPEDPAVDMMLRQSQALGDAEAVQRITAARGAAQHSRPFSGLNDQQTQNAVMGPDDRPGAMQPPSINADTPRNFRNNNPGNLRDGDYAKSLPGYAGTDGAFAKFNTMEDGFRAANANLDSYARRGIVTPRQIIQSWAPASDNNNPALYTQQFQARAGINPDAPLPSDPQSRAKALSVIAQVEGGKNPYSEAQIASAIRGGAMPPGSANEPPASYARANPGKPWFTQDQLAANPYLMSAYIHTMAADPEDRLSTGRQLGEAAVNAFKSDIAPAANDIAHFQQLRQQYQDKLGDLGDKIDGYTKADNLARFMGGPQATAYTANIVQAAQGSDIHTANMAAAFKEQMDRRATNLADHPLDEATRRGWTPPPAPIDPSNPQAMTQAIMQRGVIAGKIGTFTGGDAVSVFDKDADVPLVKNIIANGTSDQKLQLLGPLSNLPPDVRAATFKSIGADKDAQVFGAAGNVSQHDPQAAADILKGQDLLKQEPRLGPNSEDKQSLGIATLPPADFPQGVRGTILNAAEAYYAKLSADANDTTQAKSAARWDKAIDAVTGGVVDFKGSKVIVPQYGMTDDDFHGVMRSLTDADVAGSRLSSGQPLPASALQPSMWGSNQFRLQSYGDGTYLVFSGADNARQYLRSAPGGPDEPNRGGPFVLDLTGKKPTVVPLPVGGAMSSAPMGQKAPAANPSVFVGVEPQEDLSTPMERR